MEGLEKYYIFENQEELEEFQSEKQEIQTEEEENLWKSFCEKNEITKEEEKLYYFRIL